MSAAADHNFTPFFAITSHGARFAVEHLPIGKPRGAVLYVPPFAEEMNKSRRMSVLAAQRLANDGWHVIRPDLHGCGDSEGSFVDATWSSWFADLEFWLNWLESRTTGPILLWSVRAGALIVADWLSRSQTALPLLLWHPTINGQQYLSQFLRLRAAAEMLDARSARGVVSRLKESLDSGSPVSVAGYMLGADLAKPLASSQLTLPSGYSCPACILEITAAAHAEPAPAFVRIIQNWSDMGITASYYPVVGPKFWQTVEIETVPALLRATVDSARELSR